MLEGVFEMLRRKMSTRMPGRALGFFAGALAAILTASIPGAAVADEPASAPATPPSATSPGNPAPAAASSTAPAADPVPVTIALPSGTAPRDPAAAPAVPVRYTPRAHHEGTPPSAFNPLTNQVKWNPHWPKFRPVEYVVTGVMGIATFAAFAIPPDPTRWTDITPLDREVRNVLRLDTQGDRNTASDASDLILALMVNQLVVDATLVAWWGHDRPSVAWQMVLIDLEALALTGGIQAIVSGVSSRWRPYRDTCQGQLESQSRDCQENKQYRSFFSGHTSGAFTAAGLMCMNHAYIPLYGGGTREVLTCAGAFAAAATVGTLRVVADQHFATDALVGAAFGTLVGLGVPWLFHYRGGALPEEDARAKKANEVSLHVAPGPLGVVAFGEF